MNLSLPTSNLALLLIGCVVVVGCSETAMAPDSPRTLETAWTVPVEVVPEVPRDRLPAVPEDPGLVVPEPVGMSLSFDDALDSGSYEVQEFMGTLGIHLAHTVSRGAGVRVAILDTGVDPTHPDLVGRIVGGWDYVDQDDTPWEVADGVDNDGNGTVDEAYGHGTHVAALIALAAPQAELLVFRVLDSDGVGMAVVLRNALKRAVGMGAHVVNLSLGMNNDFAAVGKQIEMLDAAEVVIVSSAGNRATSTLQFPGAYPNVLGIASVGVDGRLSAFSNYGWQVFAAAPGEGIVSAYPGGAMPRAAGLHSRRRWSVGLRRWSVPRTLR